MIWCPSWSKGSKLECNKVLSSAHFYLSLSWKHAISRLILLGERLYADTLVIILEAIGELLEEFFVWKSNLETTGLRVNVGKRKIMVKAHNTPKPVEASKFPCRVCNKGVWSNSVKCLVCGFWVHRCCSKVKVLLKPNPDFKCKKCRDEVLNVTIPDIEPVDINGKDIQKVRTFCYFSDFIGQHCGYFNDTTARIGSAWKKFRELLRIPICCGLSFKT